VLDRGLLMLLLAFPVSGPVPARADPDPGTRTIDSKIVFHTSRYTAFEEICIMDPDGTDVTRLTFFPYEYNLCPALSPDGTRIAFESTRYHGVLHLWVMNVDGSNQHRVTDAPSAETLAAWSPDGTKIACSVTVDGASEIYTMNADGTNRLRLTTNPARDSQPDWSPDGTRILFTSLRNGHDEVYLMNADGTDQEPLLNTPNGTWGARWSPDGTRIAYVMEVSSPVRHTIHVVNHDGTDDATILDTAWDSFAPDWAPDGSRIAFLSFEYGSTAEICSVWPDGTDLQRLTFGLTGNGPPSWGPTPATSAVDSPRRRGAGLSLVNPAHSRVNLRLDTEQAGPASVEIFDSAGGLVRTLLREPLAPGTRTVTWDGRNNAGRQVCNGMYHCRFVSGEASRTARLVYVR
jgi:Tol biopolymer transport system component